MKLFPLSPELAIRVKKYAPLLIGGVTTAGLTLYGKFCEGFGRETALNNAMSIIEHEAPAAWDEMESVPFPKPKLVDWTKLK